MGEIKTLYHRSFKLPKRSNSRALTVDAAENIHLHYRDLRIEYSLDEFNEFMNHMIDMYDELKQWRIDNPTWTESNPDNFKDEDGVEFTKNKNKLNEHSVYWDDRISIEQKSTGSYHIKWRNYRFEMDKKSFKRWINAFEETKKYLLFRKFATSKIEKI